MPTTKSQFNIKNIPPSVENRIVKEALRKANQDQLNLIKKYDKAVAAGKIKPVR